MRGKYDFYGAKAGRTYRDDAAQRHRAVVAGGGGAVGTRSVGREEGRVVSCLSQSASFGVHTLYST